MNYQRLPQVLLLAGALALGASAAAIPVHAAGSSGSLELLTQKLESDDFRMQVQAALILGKTGDARALKALTKSLKDKSAAVRAASAAALGTFGDPAALPALRQAENDASPVVKRRITSTIAVLEQRSRTQTKKRLNATLLVKFDTMHSRSGSVEAMGAAAHASREALEKVPSVAVLNATEDPKAASARHHRPVVMVRTSLQDLSASVSGSDTIISARVEFLVERFPERSIVGRVSGNASVQSSVGNATERAQLQDEAVGAAVDSALRSGAEALLAAASRG